MTLADVPGPAARSGGPEPVFLAALSRRLDPRRRAPRLGRAPGYCSVRFLTKSAPVVLSWLCLPGGSLAGLSGYRIAGGMKAGTMAKLSGPVRVPGLAAGSRSARAAWLTRRVPGLAAGGTAVAVTAALALAGGAPVAASAATAGPAAAAAAPGRRRGEGGRAAGAGQPGGLRPRSPKVAFAMLAKPVKSVRYTVTGPRNVTLWGQSTTDAGRWSSRYGAVYKLDFSQLTEPGRYRVRIDAAGQTAVSPAFEIAPSADLYHRLVLNAVRYFTSERDGGDVVHSVLSREPGQPDRPARHGVRGPDLRQ